MQKGFLIDISRCTACHSCALACKSWNNLEPDQTMVPGSQGVNFRRVSTIEAGEAPGVTILHCSLSCMHCEHAVCLAACPAGAISKRTEDGIVVVDPEKCNGCRACLAACPFDIPQFGAVGTMQKCDYCLDRIEVGLEPICVTTCPTRAIRAGTLENLQSWGTPRGAFRLASACGPALFIIR